MSVLVTHPGRQHSHQAALGLERAGMLAGYWAGVPAIDTQGRVLPHWLRAHYGRYHSVDLPSSLVRWFPVTPAIRRIGDAILPRRFASTGDFLACRLFDQWAAASLRHFAADAVIACEISALSTFRVARRRGLTTILDAPSIHHAAQDAMHGTSDRPSLHRRIVNVKNQEIALADHVLTVSDLARETYIAGGVPDHRVHAVDLGADLELFRPRGDAPQPGRDDGVFRFV